MKEDFCFILLCSSHIQSLNQRSDVLLWKTTNATVSPPGSQLYAKLSSRKKDLCSVLCSAYILLLEIRHIQFVLWKLYINKGGGDHSKIKIGLRKRRADGGGAGGLWWGGTLTNTERAVISKHRLLHCDTEHLYSPVPWGDGVEGWGGGRCVRIIILIIMITTISKHSKKDIYRLKSIL